MKKTLFTAVTVTSLVLWSLYATAGPKDVIDRDCTAAKAGKNVAMKATIGVGGPCGPADAAKDTAKNAAGIEDKKDKKTNKKKGKKKDEKKLKKALK
ncbi:MAG: hypothetical protein KAR01_05690 [Desulfocapsa sp.]|nr:hypothetical protein [Desulfocapsa sp.]